MRKKPFLYLLIAFFFIQVLVDLAQSVTVLPFIHYGMYSESFKKADSLKVFEIRVNGELLRAQDFGIEEWDRIHGPLVALEKQERSNDFAFDKEKMRQGLAELGLEGLYRWGLPGMGNDPGLSAAFPSWYRDHLAAVVKQPIRALEVDKAWYRCTDGRWELLRKSTWIQK